MSAISQKVEALGGNRRNPRVPKSGFNYAPPTLPCKQGNLTSNLRTSRPRRDTSTMPSLTTTTTSPVTRLSTSLTFSRLLVFSALLRIALIVYSEWHDARPDAVVKYTDVDYRVLSDAARFVSHPSTAGSDGPTMNVAKGSMGGLVGSGECVSHPTSIYTCI